MVGDKAGFIGTKKSESFRFRGMPASEASLPTGNALKVFDPAFQEKQTLLAGCKGGWEEDTAHVRSPKVIAARTESSATSVWVVLPLTVMKWYRPGPPMSFKLVGFSSSG